MSPIVRLCLLLSVGVNTDAYVDHELCGLSKVENTRIFRGSAVKPGELPWVAHLYIASNWWSSLFFYDVCTAGILDERWILTAAHCLIKREGGFVDITFGRVDIRDRSSGGKVTISKLRKNFNYFIRDGYPNNRNKDIVLLFLRERNKISTLPDRIEEIEHVNRMCLIPNPKFTYDNGQAVAVAGYGMLNKTDLNGNVLWRLDAVTAYRELHRGLGFDNWYNFAFMNDSISVPKACIGDSGAPITFYQKSTSTDTALAKMRRAVAVGVLSRGKGDCEAIPKENNIQAYTVGVRVDWTLRWIDYIMSLDCNAMEPVLYQSSKLSRFNLCSIS